MKFISSDGLVSRRMRSSATGFAVGLTLLAGCDVSVVDQAPSEPRDQPTVPGHEPAPESDQVASACAGLGYDIGRPDMVINAGQADIALPARAHRIEIVSAPALLDQADTEYVLMQDVATAHTAFEISAHDVTLNLNGHTVTYGTADSPTVSFPNGTAGVKTHWGVTGTVIANGEIAQGDGACVGDVSGRNCNPVIVQENPGLTQIGGLSLSYHTPDTSGIVALGDGEIYQNTVEDSGNQVTYAGTGVPAIRTEARSIHHNKLLSVRHRGIVTGSNSDVSYNEIHINSNNTNSYGIMVWEIQNFAVHHNKIYGAGNHPIGIGPVGTGGTDGEIYSNYVATENTRTHPDSPFGSSAFRIRTYDGWCDRIEVMCNYFVVLGGNEHPELQGNSWGRGLWIGDLQPGNRVDIHHNYVEALTLDPQPRADGHYHSAVSMSSGGYNEGLYLEDNTIVANYTMIALTEGYGGVGEGPPKFIRNRMIRKDTYPTYKTIADRLFEYWPVTALFIDNVYEGGSTPSVDTVELLQHCTENVTDVGFGHMDNGNTIIDYWLTDVAERVANASSYEPYGNCGYKVIP